MADSPEQMAFSFFQDMKEEMPAGQPPVAERDFETEDDALDALLSTAVTEEDENIPPFDMAEPENKETPSGMNCAGERFPVSAEEEDREIDAAIERIFGVVEEAESMAALESEIQSVAAEITAAEKEEEPQPVVIELREKRNSFPPLTEQTLRRAALGFLAGLNPDGAGMKFFSGSPKIKADAGAFFMENGEVTGTVLVMTCMELSKCAPDASCRAELLKELDEAKAAKAALEEMLKEKEPELKDDSLFPETQCWEFKRTKNRKYHACLRKIEKLEYAICHGSKFDRLMFEQCADKYYLAVPAGVEPASELPEEWGILSIAENYQAEVIRPAKICGTTPEKRTLFAMRAAAAGLDGLLFANGISLSGGRVCYHLPPKRRRKYC